MWEKTDPMPRMIEFCCPKTEYQKFDSGMAQSSSKHPSCTLWWQGSPEVTARSKQQILLHLYLHLPDSQLSCCREHILSGWREQGTLLIGSSHCLPLLLVHELSPLWLCQPAITHGRASAEKQGRNGDTSLGWHLPGRFCFTTFCQCLANLPWMVSSTVAHWP